MTLYSSECIPEITREQLGCLYRKKPVAPGNMISEISMYHKPFIICGGAGYTGIIICIFGNQIKLLIVFNLFDLMRSLKACQENYSHLDAFWHLNTSV